MDLKVSTFSRIPKTGTVPTRSFRDKLEFWIWIVGRFSCDWHCEGPARCGTV